MKKLVKLALFLILVCPFIGTIISSCNDEINCSTAGRAMLNLDFRKKVGTSATNDTIDSLTVRAFGTDSIIVNREKKVTRVQLPLRYTKDTTILVFEYSHLTKDTITVVHTNTPKFVSMDCGYEMNQNLLKISQGRKRDSIQITYASTNTNGTRNLELFHNVRP